jgi:hypothetical protein
MNIKTKKYQLVHQLLMVNDEELIDAVKSLLDFGLKHQNNKETVVEDFWDDLTPTQQKRMDASLHQMEQGIGLDHGA